MASRGGQLHDRPPAAYDPPVPRQVPAGRRRSRRDLDELSVSSGVGERALDRRSLIVALAAEPARCSCLRYRPRVARRGCLRPRRPPAARSALGGVDRGSARSPAGRDVDVHRVAAVVRARRPRDRAHAVATAESLDPRLIPSPQRRAAYWSDYGRALAHVRGRTADAVRALRQAELISPVGAPQRHLAEDP